MNSRAPLPLADTAPDGSSGGPAARVTALIEMVEQLAADVRLETAALKAREGDHEIARLAGRKQVMLQRYRDASLLLTSSGDDLAALPEELRQGLRRAFDELTASTEENEKTLSIRAEAQKILVNTLVTVIKRSQQPAPSYGAARRPRDVAAATLDTRL